MQIKKKRTSLFNPYPNWQRVSLLLDVNWWKGVSIVWGIVPKLRSKPFWTFKSFWGNQRPRSPGCGKKNQNWARTLESEILELVNFDIPDFRPSYSIEGLRELATEAIHSSYLCNICNICYVLNQWNSKRKWRQSLSDNTKVRFTAFLSLTTSL